MSDRPAQPHPMPSAAPPAGAAGADPSMEDILASIRRILSEDEAQPPAAQAQPEAVQAAAEPPRAAAPLPPEPQHAPPPPAPKPADDVLVLDPSMLVQPEPPTPRPIMPEPPQPALPVPGQDPAQDASLVAPTVAAAAASSVSHLVRRLSAERGTAVHRGGPTIEDLVREEVRPLLKAWLDEHLPSIVDRAVRAEIERVVARAMG